MIRKTVSFSFNTYAVDLSDGENLCVLSEEDKDSGEILSFKFSVEKKILVWDSDFLRLEFSTCMKEIWIILQHSANIAEKEEYFKTMEWINQRWLTIWFWKIRRDEIRAVVNESTGAITIIRLWWKRIKKNIRILKKKILEVKSFLNLKNIREIEFSNNINWPNNKNTFLTFCFF